MQDERRHGYGRKPGAKPFHKEFRMDFRKDFRKGGFQKNDFRKKFFDRAKARVHEEFSKKDASLIHATRLIDDLDSAKSLLYQRFDEWVKNNFPELPLRAEESVCAVYAEFGAREAFEEARLTEIVGEQKAREIMEKARGSYGIEFDEEEKKAVKEFAREVLVLFKARKEMQEFVVERAKTVLRNLSTLIDPLLAARLVSTAGGLKKLANMPASTIQVIGAERALFKHLRTGTKPPKHGIIFQCQLINAAPLKQRGKIARALAAKLCIAAKADFFTGNFIAGKLKADLDRRLAQIRQPVSVK